MSTQTRQSIVYACMEKEGSYQNHNMSEGWVQYFELSGLCGESLIQNCLLHNILHPALRPESEKYLKMIPHSIIKYCIDLTSGSWPGVDSSTKPSLIGFIGRKGAVGLKPTPGGRTKL